MSALLKFEQIASWQECCNCGITFGMMKSWDDRLRNNHNTFYCPNGHPQSYSGQTEAAKLQKQLDEERRLRVSAESDAQWQRSVAKNAQTQATKARNKLRRVETRINAGVCPHCNRTFKQLAAHMKCKHADVVHEPAGTPDHASV